MRRTKRLLTLTIVVALVTTLLHCGRRDHNAAAFQQKIIDTVQLQSTTVGVSVVASGLNVPWDLVWGPDDHIWFTEQDGRVSRINPTNGSVDTIFTLPGFYRKRLALASMAVHHDMKNYPYVFFNHLFLRDSAVYTRIVRYTYRENANPLLSDPFVLLEYPGHAGHNGSRMVIAPDGKLMIATGDAFDERNPQDTASVSGKVLRLNIDGSIPFDNPIAGSAVWSFGFRVPQGLAYSDQGTLYTAEHGDATDDEVNLITRGGNYGYPIVTGYCDSASEHAFCNTHVVSPPIKAWTPTIAPAGMTYYNNDAIPEWKNALLMATLKNQSLRVLRLNEEGTAIEDELVMFEGNFGRLRDVCVSPSGDVYLSTSNRDWNPAAGFPLDDDDRIIRLSVLDEAAIERFAKDTTRRPIERPSAVQAASAGEEAYNKYCSSCHKADGKGVEGSFPTLMEAPILYGAKESLIAMVLRGSAARAGAERKYDQQMPAFEFLGDEEIAQLLQYVRKKFGNNHEKIFAADAARVRALKN